MCLPMPETLIEHAFGEKERSPRSPRLGGRGETELILNWLSGWVGGGMTGLGGRFSKKKETSLPTPPPHPKEEKITPTNTFVKKRGLGGRGTAVIGEIDRISGVGWGRGATMRRCGWGGSDGGLNERRGVGKKKGVAAIERKGVTGGAGK